MKAVIVRSFGPYEQAEYGDLPDPVPAEGEVTVDLFAAEANFPDILYIEGTYQRKPPLPFSPGLGGAGRVSRLGPGVDGLSPGDRVMVLPQNGTFAERIALSAEHCFAIPDEMPFDVAAAFGLVYQTAWFALTERARLTTGETVLVLGATGGIGMAAVQLAKALGAGRVIAASRGSDGAAAARAFGADAVIDSAMKGLGDGLRAALREATGGNGADVVIDPVGGALSAAAMRCLVSGGRHVVVGFASGEIPAFGGGYLLVKNIAVAGLQWTDYRAREPGSVRSAQARIFDLWRRGALDPHVSARLPLARYAEALGRLKDGAARGKIILTIQDEAEHSR